ncbi:hypothetical protein MMC27_002079 [Xylographa pallens]|nr:hypothetical protein [Xylographa pallens]
MPPTDYAATPGGSLKLKGAVPPTKITKHKKKKRRLADPPRPDSAVTTGPAADPLTSHAPDKASARKASGAEEEEEEEEEEQETKRHNKPAAGDAPLAFGAGKTDAERRHDERRRKRVSFSWWCSGVEGAWKEGGGFGEIADVLETGFEGFG